MSVICRAMLVRIYSITASCTGRDITISHGSATQYYSRPHTFGFAAHYNAYVGHWGFSFGIATGGGGGSWIGNGDHSWGRNGHWFGFGGYRPVVRHGDVHESFFHNQYTSRVRTTTVIRPGRADVYNRSVYDRRKDVRWDLPHTRPAVDEHRPDVHAGEHVPPEAVRHEELHNDVLSDREGNVYRKTDAGWEVHDKTGWQTKPEGAAEEHPCATRRGASADCRA